MGYVAKGKGKGGWHKNCPECLLNRRKGAVAMTFRLTPSEASPTKDRPPAGLGASWRLSTPADEPLRVRLTRKSGNAKTGPIPVSTSSPSTCPPSCAWYGKGCYAEHHYIGARWRKVAQEGLSWEGFLRRVRALPVGQLWRHNEAGDLPGRGEELDAELLKGLVRANQGRRGFTYCHKKQIDFEVLEWACDEGLTVNISCDSFGEVDQLRGRGVRAPLTVVVPADSDWRQTKTRDGHHVITCPAQLRDDVTCVSCKLCAVHPRKAVIAFRAHGQSAKMVNRNSSNLRLPMVSDGAVPVLES
jgi:hypothetical protein